MKLVRLGIVVDRGAKVTSVSRGARVFGVCSEQELFADYSVTNCLNVCELPCDIDFKDGAVMGLDYLVAWDILHEKLKVHSAPASTKCGNRVLVKNAEVSIGLASCQLASLRGMCVLAETNSESSLHFMEHSVGGIKEAFIAGSRQRDQVKTEQCTPSKNCCSNLESHRDNVYKGTHSEETGHNEGKGQHGLNCGGNDVGSCYVISQCHSTALSKGISSGRISCSMRSKNMAGKCCEVDYVIDNSTTHRGSHLSHHHIGHRIKQGTKCHHTIDLSCLSNNGKVVLVDRGSSHGGKSVLIDNCSLLVGKNVTICGCGIENISLEQRAKILPEISSLFAKRQLKAHVVKSYPRELLRHNNVKSVSLKRQQFGNAVLLFNSLSETL